jgi:phosphate butyryltransferase
MIKSFAELKNKAKEKGKKKLVVACAGNRTVIEASYAAMKEGLITPIFVGDSENILEQEKITGIGIDTKYIVDIKNKNEAVKEAVRIVRSGDGDFLLKGMVKTSIFLKGILEPDSGLKTSRRLSHTAIIETKTYPKLIQMTDGGMNIKPDIETKVDIIKNSCSFAKSLGITKPKVALLSAIEIVNPEMQDTIDAAIIIKMGERGQLGNILIDGPLSLDLAISKESCKIKGIKNDVAGDADILIVPDIAAGNIAAKSLIYMGGAQAAGIVLGAKVPVVMLSRSDDKETKLNSIALGVLSC